MQKKNLDFKLNKETLKILKGAQVVAGIVFYEKDLPRIKKQIELNNKALQTLRKSIKNAKANRYKIKSELFQSFFENSYDDLLRIKKLTVKNIQSLETTHTKTKESVEKMKKEEVPSKILAELVKSNTSKPIDFLVNIILNALVKELGSYAKTSRYIEANEGLLKGLGPKRISAQSISARLNRNY